MNSILNDEATEFEGRTYVNPNLTVEGTNQFIDNYRALQSQNNAEISNQTQNLGTDIQSNLGGLLGGKGYWTSRYQTPQTNQTLQNLRTTAQAAALNTALANEKAIWEKRYKDAYRNYQKRQNRKQNTTTPTTTIPKTTQLETDVNSDVKSTDVSLYDPTKESPFGKVTLWEDGSTRWVDPNSGAQYLLKSPREFDSLIAENTLLGHNPKDGAAQIVNGKTMVYDAATNMWYERGPMIFGGGVKLNG